MNRAILNIVLGVILLGLAGIIYITGGKKSPPKPPLTRLNAATITAIEIDHPHSKVIRLKKQSGHWRLTSPVTVAASPYAVSSLLDIATLPCQKAIKPQAVKLSDLGLEPPRYRIRFNKTIVDVGDVEPLKYRRYMKTGSRICLVRNPVAAGLNGKYAGLASRHLVNSPQSVVSVLLPAFTLTKVGKKPGSWTVSPAQPNEARTAASRLAHKWLSAEAEWNKETSKHLHQTAHLQHVQILLKGGKTIDFLIVRRSPQFVLERPNIGIRYEFSEDQGRAMLNLAKTKPTLKTQPNGKPTKAGIATPRSS